MTRELCAITEAVEAERPEVGFMDTLLRKIDLFELGLKECTQALQGKGIPGRGHSAEKSTVA